MPLFSRRPNAPIDTTARDYLASSPPSARVEALASACVLGTTELAAAATERFGSLAVYPEFAQVEALAHRLLHQDDDFAAAVARKIAFNTSVLASFSRAGTVDGWISTVLAANGVQQGAKDPIELVPGQNDVDGSGRTLADLFWMVFRAVVLGQGDAPAEWSFYSSLYTDAEKHELSYTIIAWGALALARTLNTGELRWDVPTFRDEYRTIPPLTKAGWYPYPTKNGTLPNGDAPVQSYWDGARWTDRCRIWTGGRFKEMTRSPHGRPVD